MKISKRCNDHIFSIDEKESNPCQNLTIINWKRLIASSFLTSTSIIVLLSLTSSVSSCFCLKPRLGKTRFQGRVFSTAPTKSIMGILLKDYLRVTRDENDAEPLYTDEDITKAINRIEAIDFHEVCCWCFLLSIGEMVQQYKDCPLRSRPRSGGCDVLHSNRSSQILVCFLFCVLYVDILVISLT